MSRKHNAPHPMRGRSHYRDRLAKRGYQGGAQPHMEDLDTLRLRQQRRTAASVSPFWADSLSREGAQS